MVERFLASVIILAMLVLIMFIAFPGDSADDPDILTRPKDQEQIAQNGQKPAPAQPGEQPSAKEPTAEERAVSAKDESKPAEDLKNGDAAPEEPGAASDKPQTAPSGQQDAQKTRTAEPTAETSDAPGPAVTDAAKKEAPRLEQDGQQASEPAISPRSADAPETEPLRRPKPNREAKADKVNLKPARSAHRKTVPGRSEPRQVKTRESRRDEIGRYIRQADYSDRWRRTHYYECVGGRCDCSCDRPYWARSGPVCWEY